MADKNKMSLIALVDRLLARFGYSRRVHVFHGRGMSPKELIVDRYEYLSDELEASYLALKAARNVANLRSEACEKLSAEKKAMKEWIDAN